MLSILEEEWGSLAAILSTLTALGLYTSPLKYDMCNYLDDPATKDKIVGIKETAKKIVKTLIRKFPNAKAGSDLLLANAGVRLLRLLNEETELVNYG